MAGRRGGGGLIRLAVTAGLAALVVGCSTPIPPGQARVTIHAAAGDRRFLVEVAATAASQEAGLMHRTRLAPDGGMLFAPYPAGGGAPARATVWMKDTPLPLDILFVRADHMIDRIAVGRPNDETFLSSDQPAAAVLELPGGSTAAAGIRAGDRIDWELGH